MGKAKIAIISPEVFSYGAMLIGGILKKGGHQISLFNNLRPQNVMSMDITGLSLTSVFHLLNARELVSKLKAGSKQSIIVGGTISQISELAFRILPEIDVVVIGEGEETAPELVEALKMKKDLEEVNGISFKHDNEMVKTPPRKPASLDNRALPEIPTDIGRQNIRGANVYVETHRGCLGNCSFCQVPCFFGREVRSRPVNDIVVEVKAFIKAGARKIALFGGTSTQYGYEGSRFNDEEFITMLKEVSRITGSYNLSVPDLRVDMVNEAVLKAVRKYTIGFVIYGMESGSDRILAKMRKGITVDKIREGVKRARKADLEVAGSFIVGYPWETDEDYAETKKLVEELMLDDYSISIADPLPGTLLAEEVVQLSREENPAFIKDSSKLGVLHKLTVAETRALDLMITASMVRSRPLPITDELYNTFLRETKKQGEETRLVTNILKKFYKDTRHNAFT
jgi:B12-binding domain/radical SAM domain protein